MKEIVCFVFACSVNFGLPVDKGNLGDNQGRTAITAKEARELLVSSSEIISKRDVGFVAAKVHQGPKYPDYLRKMLVVKDVPVEGLSKALGFQIFSVQLESHMDELVIYHKSKLQGLEISFGLSSIKSAKVLGGALYVTHENSKGYKGYIKVTAKKNGSLRILRKGIDSKNRSTFRSENQIERRKQIEKTLDLIQQKIEK